VDLHGATGGPRRQSVPNRVLDQRLERHRRHERDPRPVVDGLLEAQTAAEPDPPDGQVVLEEGQLLVQRDVRTVAAIEGQPQQVTQVLEHPSGLPRIGLEMRRDGVQGIEQEMRIELQTQRL